MLINLRNLVSLPVETVSGKRLGKIVDINFSVENHSVFQYQARSGYFSRRVFLISPVQVKEITAKKMVVDDSVLKISETEEKKSEPTGEFFNNAVSTRE